MPLHCDFFGGIRRGDAVGVVGEWGFRSSCEFKFKVRGAGLCAEDIVCA